jgi:ATP-dependent helicase HrpA
VHERTTLFGLTLQSGRKIPFERVDPQGARELFIRHALVQMDYDSKAPFFVHNLKLLEDTEYLQHKGRRADLLLDAAQLQPFFDARIPPEVTSGAAFEAWRRKAEKEQPRLLFLTEADIAGGDPAQLDPTAFPDHLDVGPLRIALQYRFDPGHAEDGVTALVPLHMLTQLDAAAFDWLVPGLLEEKVTALIRSLPKGLRVTFVPVPAFAARALDQLQVGKGPLKTQLATALTRAAGIRIPSDAFRDDQLPPHLRMNYALLDDAERVVDSGRDLAALRARHTAAATRTFSALARQALLHTGCRAWTFGELAEAVDDTLDGQRVFGHPALVDEGESVGVRVFATRAEAAASQARGLTRLIRLVHARDLKAVRRDLPVDVQAELAYRKLAAHPFLHAQYAPGRDLRDDLLDAVVRAVFLEGQSDVRSAAALDARIATRRGEVALVAREAGRAVQQVLAAQSAILAPLAKARVETAQDVRTQLGHLLYSGFLVATPLQRIHEMPRYLKAIQHRLEKATLDPARDLKLLREVAAVEEPYWRAVRAEQGSRPPESDPFRWLLEEFRVSLFAQQLKTAVAVSAKRLADAWQSRVRSP